MCAQLKVGGSGTAVPAQEEMVKFPGAYSGSEGALNKNGYHYRRQVGGGEAFEFPGPKVAVLAGGEGGASGVPSVPSTGVPPAPSTANVPAPQQQQPGTYAGEGSCSTNYKRDMVRRRVPIDAAHGHAARRSAH
jgi:hypothetical protein